MQLPASFCKHVQSLHQSIKRVPVSRFSVALVVLLLVLSACQHTPNSANPNATQLEKARRLIEQGNFEEAFVQLNKALKEAPEDPQVHLNLGWLYLYTDAPHKAEQELQKAEILSPNLAEAHHLRGALFAARAKQKAEENPAQSRALQEKALDEFHLALAQDPQNAQTYFDESIALIALDRNEEALASLDKGFDYIPEKNLEMQVNFQMASCDAHARLQLYEEAIQDCEQALQFTTNPTSKERLEDMIQNMRLMNPGLKSTSSQAAVEDNISD